MSPRAEVMIWATVINTQTHTQTDRQTDRQLLTGYTPCTGSSAS